MKEFYKSEISNDDDDALFKLSIIDAVMTSYYLPMESDKERQNQ